MRTTLLPIVAAVLSLGGLAACGGDDDSKTQTLTLDSKSGRTLFVEDNGRRGPTAGDERTFSQALTEDGKPVGRLDGSTTVVTSAGGLEHRVGTIQFTLTGGTIVASGVYSAAPGVFVPKGGVVRPIVGGTGKYLRATGQVTQTSIAGGEIRNVLEIRLGDD